MLVSLALMAAPFCTTAFAQTRRTTANPRNYRDLLRTLAAGQTLRLEAGLYEHGLPIHGLVGSADAPIVIEGPVSGGRAIFVARPGANTVSIVDSAHVVIRNLVLDGRHLAVDAVKAEGHARWAHHITLENLRIVNHGAHQSLVGISTKCPAWGWVVRGNAIVGAGTGMYFGNSDGSAPFIASLIEGNRVIDPIGYAVEIKHQQSRPGIDGLPAGDQHTAIRRNVFVKSRGGSTGEMARPNLLVGHFPLSGRGAQDRYLIYRNLFFDNPTEALFQGEGNIALYNNLFVNPHGDAVAIQPHKHLPRRIAVFQNTVVASGSGIKLVGQEAGAARYVAGNLVCSPRPLVGEIDGHNATAAFEAAAEWVVQPFGSIETIDLSARRTSAIALHPLPRELAALPDADLDYLGRRRDGATAGACALKSSGSPPCR
jgi:hypothetical protein